MCLSPSVSPKFIATSLLSGLTLKSVSFWDCLVLQKFPLVTWNPWMTNLQPGCRLTSSLTSFLTSPVLLPLHIWIHSFIHPSIHSKDAYRQDAYPHTAMAWRGENHLLSKSSQFNRRARATDDEDNFVNTGNLSPSSWPHILALSVPFSGADNSLQPMGSGGEASELRLHWLSIFLSVVWNKWFYPPEPM